MEKLLKLFSIGKKLLLCTVIRCVALFVKRQPKNIAIGSWCGDRYADNSRYLLEYLDKYRPEYKLFWVGKKAIEDEVLANTERVVFLRMGTFRTYLTLLTCQYFFFSQMHSADISDINVFRGSTMCYLHHGMPIKKWASDGLNQETRTKGFFRRIVAHYLAHDVKYDYFVTSSALHSMTNCSALSYRGCKEEKNIGTGTPRNDMYVNYDARKSAEYKKIYAKKLGFSPDSKVFIYLPTYRRVATQIFSFGTLSCKEQSKLTALLKEKDIVLIEKSHVAEKICVAGKSTDHLVFADRNLNVQELMLFADCVISDYSGAYLDFILLERPVIHFAYDYEYYRTVDSGLYYDIEDFSAGPVVESFDALISEMSHIAEGTDLYKQKRAYVRQKYMTYETGNASSNICRAVLKD